MTAQPCPGCHLPMPRVKTGAYCSAACERRATLQALRKTLTTGHLDLVAPLPAVASPPKTARPRVRRTVVDQITATLTSGDHLDARALIAATSAATPAERAAALARVTRDLEQRARAAGWRPAPRPRADDEDDDDDDPDDDD